MFKPNNFPDDIIFVHRKHMEVPTEKLAGSIFMKNDVLEVNLLVAKVVDHIEGSGRNNAGVNLSNSCDTCSWYSG